MKIVVFGGAGFIGSHFVDLISSKSEVQEILVIDSLTYAGNIKNLNSALQIGKVRFLQADLLNPEIYMPEIKNFSHVVNFAAESHVDRSISGPKPFFMSNAVGVGVLCDALTKSDVTKFLQVSTDEVYGPVLESESVETDLLLPSSPYSSSKASGDLIALSFWNTFKFPTIVTRGSNTYGPRQFPEKLIPLAIQNLKQGKKIPVYGNGMQVREWMHVFDHANGIWHALTQGIDGEIYNVGSGERLTNIALLGEILSEFKLDKNSLEFVEDRKGHDIRYALNSKKLSSLTGWTPKYKLNEAIKSCRDW